MGILDLFSLNNKISVVTGAGQGLGKQIALDLSEAGAVIVAVDINADNVDSTAAIIRKRGGTALSLSADLTQTEQIEEMVESIKNEYGRIDILVNNAGVNRRKPAVDVSENDWDYVLDIDLKGLFFCSKIIGKEMIKNKQGVIINLASISGTIVNKGITQVAYEAAKGGVLSLTRALAAEWVNYNIRVNAISPSIVMTPQVQEDFVEDKHLRNLTISNIPMGRYANPQEISPVVVFLASDAASYITGHNLLVDGGYTIW